MQNPRLATRYAKSLMDIAIEQNVVEPIYQDMLSLQNMFANSPDLVNLMRSPIIHADKKQAIFKTLIGGKVNNVTEQFIALITNKTREYYLPEMVDCYIEQYKEKNNIATVQLTTANPLDAAEIADLTTKIQAQLQGKKIDLVAKVDESLIGGFVLESNNNLFDASIARDLKDISKQFLLNHHIPKLR